MHFRIRGQPTRSEPSAFTLIELLVVVAIIGVVIAILLPTLSKARSAAQAAKCLSNLRVLATSVQSYEYDNHGQLVINSQFAGLSYFFSYKVTSDTSQNFSRVQICPATLNYANAAYTQRDAVTVNSYGWNWWIGSFVQQSPNPIFLKPGNVSNASEIVLVADIMQTLNTGLSLNGGGDQNVFDPFCIPGSYITPGGPNLNLKQVLGRANFHGRHNGNGSVLWLDGHAALQPAIPVPLSTPYDPNPATVNKLKLPPDYYNKYHIGYLARSAADLTSMNSEYYFVFQKGPLADNNIYTYLNSSKYLWK